MLHGQTARKLLHDWINGNMEKGFFYIDRRIEDWRWWGNLTAMGLWLYILEKCNWKDGWWKGEKVERGSFITSKSKIAEELKLNRRTVDHWLKVFEDDGQIAVMCTARYTKITALNYGKYQSSSCADAQVTTQLTAQLTAHNRRNKEINKYINGGGNAHAREIIERNYHRALDTYLGQESQVDEAYTKLLKILANLPEGDTIEVTPNINDACLYAQQFWIENNRDGIGNPEGYIRKILTKKKRKEQI